MKTFIKKNWGELSLEEIHFALSTPLFNILEIAYKLGLSSQKTPDIKRRWTKCEDDFLKKYADTLTISQACNLIYRSRYATYQRVKFLNLQQMIGK